ncbi:hypothetical protein C8A05DRAFT_11981 [Staphylotrichum tortipilum]|uniref:Integral membrane protein n=1 Tax=Staphylotrichum tortipilum TaxID=2831512 RepID=A0AAN6RWN5_9PEZI|nr:hypothetical protein C8A05DRAFT_11981 [Staphylotrichum longicolle]
MKALAISLLPVVASAVVLGLIPAVLAHGEEHGHGSSSAGGMAGMGGMNPSAAGTNSSAPDPDAPLPEDQYPPTYFAHPEHKAAIYGHIAVMVLAWVFALPAAVMLSLARSRFTLTAQALFGALNAGGVLLGLFYKANTPDLYPGNAHSPIGWIATAVVGAQIVVGVVARAAGGLRWKRHGGEEGSTGGGEEERQGFIPVSTEAMAEHESRFPSSSPYSRFSNDSGQGTEPRTESLRSHSLSSGSGSPTAAAHKELLPRRGSGGGDDDGDDDGNEDLEAHLPFLSRRTKTRAHSVVAKVAGKVSDRVYRALVLAYNIIDRTILILGFIALCTGVIAFGRFFEGNEVFSGLAHWIKGGVFFWLGILTLGRWAGSFGDLGWAWNIRPKQPGQKWRPSAEFVESALIFFYGSTNIFLEHLGGWGGEWSATDLEHISITILFIGGGLCGMLIESVKIRDLLNYTVDEAAKPLPGGHPYSSSSNNSNSNNNREEDATLREPESYSFSTNPIPALVILLLGIMMSSHTQASMVSSMVHKQWGTLLSGASFARGLTYVVMWLRPPRSVYPSRPPTELLTAFGLISGGVIFMASASSTINGMIHYQLDAMFMYTVTMGLVGLLMAWVILMVALKGWAARFEARLA